MSISTSTQEVTSPGEAELRRGASAALAAVWEQRKEAVLGSIRLLEEGIHLVKERQDDEVRAKARREAHKLAGSLGTFGYDKGSALASEIQEILASEAQLDEIQALRLAYLARELGREVGRPSVPVEPIGASPESPSESGDRKLLLVESDAGLMEELCDEASGHGIRVIPATELDEAEGALEREQPDIVLLGLGFPQAADDTMAFLRRVSERLPELPVVVLTESDALTDRIEVARLGGRGFLNKSLSPSKVMAAVAEFFPRIKTSSAKIMAVDDDPSVLAALRAVLEPEGMELTPLQDPLRFWEALHEVAPDLLVLDVDMPGVEGVELCRVVRNDPLWKELPILFLTGSVTRESVSRVFAAGADDFVRKPFVGPELVSRIQNRLERVQLFRTMAETDVLTGVGSRRKSSQSIEQLIRLAHRSGAQMCLAAIDLDHFKSINDRHGHAAGDKVLRRTGELMQDWFRGEDVIGRWGGEEFVLAMYGLGREDAMKRVTSLLNAVREQSFASADSGERFSITFSAGVAQYPQDGLDLATLYKVADGALYAAKARGRNRVLPAGVVVDA